MQDSIFPKVQIRSKCDLVKHISHKGFSYPKALILLNDCLENYELHWRDSHHSDIKEGKYIRIAKWSILKKLHKKINVSILARHDEKLPSFIFGGVKGKDH